VPTVYSLLQYITDTLPQRCDHPLLRLRRSGHGRAGLPSRPNSNEVLVSIPQKHLAFVGNKLTPLQLLQVMSHHSFLLETEKLHSPPLTSTGAAAWSSPPWSVRCRSFDRPLTRAALGWTPCWKTGVVAKLAGSVC